MHTLLDMASSPEYLAPSAEDIDLNIDPAITAMSNGSCSSIPPSAVSYATPDPNSYSEVSHISSFDTSPVLDERMLTPVSSASSPELQHRSCRQSPFEQQQQQQHHHQEESAAQQPTPPHTASMYPYPEYMHSNQATTSMSMPSTVAEATHDLLPYLQHPHPSPGHEDAHPPPQSNPYFGSYTVSAAPHDQEQYYLPNGGDISGLGLLRQDVNGGGAYTHRPLAPITQQQHSPMFNTQAPSHFRLPRLEPIAPSANGRQYSVPRARRDRTRKNSARLSLHRRDSFSPPVQQGSYMHTGENAEMAMSQIEDVGPDEEVTLDDKTPADLRRLWDVRRKWLGKKGNGMWEDIMVEYLGEEALTENKKTQVKAALQMKIHRMLLKHGKWPERDESALIRAYKRWEESRYTELLRLYEEEMQGRKKAYEWKSQHIEAQLVKMGLEEPERDRDSKARKRKQVAARHQARSNGNLPLPTAPSQRAPPTQPQQQQQQRLPGMYEPAYVHHYAPQHYDQQQQQGTRTPSYDSAFADQVGATAPALSDEQNDRLAREILERNPFAEGGEDGEDDDDEVDVKMEMSDYASSDHHPQQHHARSRTTSLIPGLTNHHMASHHHQQHHESSSSSMPGTASPPDINAQRSAAVARQACGEMLKQQQFGPGVGV